ncbi:MAG: ATP-binding protein [Candidatus Peribacteraceae bacterium]|nr:ATP-binding protein [Candidatus Peribacteraceae bacterium]
MNLLLCPDAVPNFLRVFDLSIAPTLLYYSYVPLFVLCIFFGLFILLRDNFSMLSKYFFTLNIFFAAYIFLSIIQWIAAYLEIVHLAWQLYLFAEVGVFIFSVLFAYVFLFQREVSRLFKWCTVIILICIAIVSPTQLNVSEFDLQNCESVPGSVWPVVYIFELVCLAMIVLITVARLRLKEEHSRKLEYIFFCVGLIFFLGIFWGSNFFAELTNTYEINLIGPVGMLLFLGSIAYIIVKFKAFNAKLFGSQVLVISLWFLIGALLFVRQIEHARIVIIFTFGLVGILGINLIRSVKREIEQREKIEKLAVDLKKANKELKELDRQKDELISIVSHQLATPVTSVKWYLEMLLDGDSGELNEEQKKQLKTMQGVTEDLVDLVGMILDVSRIQLGRMKVDRSPVDLGTFFTEVLAVIEPKATVKKQQLIKSLPKSLPTASLDKRLMRMTLENLLSNAVKYTPEGGKVELNVTLKDHTLRYEVKDTGCGIPKEDQEKIFGKLFRATNVRNTEGNGLGLFAAKGAAEALGGRVWFESESGKGTTFFVEVPLTEAKDPELVKTVALG